MPREQGLGNAHVRQKAKDSRAFRARLMVLFYPEPWVLSSIDARTLGGNHDRACPQPLDKLFAYLNYILFHPNYI
jgi:hypothetical protein